MISNTNKIKKTSGFTIVELLIVIVVIGILAAITIVAYNGVQARANTTKNDTIAKEIADKAEVYAADNSGTYPTLLQLSGAAASTTHALSASAKAAIVATAAVDKVTYIPCGITGARVTGWDYTKTPAGPATEKVRTVGTC